MIIASSFWQRWTLVTLFEICPVEGLSDAKLPRCWSFSISDVKLLWGGFSTPIWVRRCYDQLDFKLVKLIFCSWSQNCTCWRKLLSNIAMVEGKAASPSGCSQLSANTKCELDFFQHFFTHPNSLTKSLPLETVVDLQGTSISPQSMIRSSKCKPAGQRVREGRIWGGCGCAQAGKGRLREHGLTRSKNLACCNDQLKATIHTSFGDFWNITHAWSLHCFKK